MNRIRELRLQKGWKQEDLAALMHVKRQAIGHYETGERGIDADTICALCDIFGCTADYLLGRSILPAADLSDEEARLLLAWRVAPDNEKAAIRAMLPRSPSFPGVKFGVNCPSGGNAGGKKPRPEPSGSGLCFVFILNTV